MKCPNCGAEMKEGCLYCEQCGEDIHIVPDFEPELELNMEQSLEHIRNDVVVEREEGAVPDNDTEGSGRKASHRKWILAVEWCCVGVFVLALFLVAKNSFQYHSLEYQVSQARKAVEKAQYEKAIEHYERAIELDDRDVSLKFELAEVYFLKNNKAEYEYMLTKIIDDPGTDAEQMMSAYGKLIAIYRAREDYQTINAILLSSGNESVKAAYHSYLADMPQFSIPGGSYEEAEALKLTVTGNGVIYYTMDGSVPDDTSDRYTAPILLENGEYLIKAIFINENGVSSEIASAEYRIDVEELEAPEFNVDSGDYATPVFITLESEPGNVYYTTDGSDPTLDSTLYTEPIPMPLGASTFRFARLEAGRSSRIVERTFELVLETDFSSDQAVEKIYQYAQQSGKIIDRSGHFDDTESYYKYQYQYVIHIADINDFYVVAELLADAQGLVVKTGNYYAVNVYSGYYYKLQMENGVYSLSEL